MDWFSFVSSGMRSIGSCFYWSQDVQTAGWSVWVFFNTVLTVRQKHQRRIKKILSNNCPINIWTLTQLFLPSCRLATIQGNAQEVPEIWSLFVQLLTLLIQCKRLMWRPLTPFFSLISTGSCILIYVQTVTAIPCHITSKEHVSPLILLHHRLNKVSGTSTLRRCGRPTGAGGMFPHRVMGGKVKQRCTSEACKWIVSSPFTLQILGKHSIWD